MKTLTILIVAICIGLCSCQKSNTDPQPGQSDSHLVGDWKLISDSTSAYSQALGVRGAKYIGTPADGFVFTADGKLSLNEGSSAASGTFTVNADGSLQLLYSSRKQGGITIMGSGDYFQTVSVDEHSATLANEGQGPAGLYLVRIIKLSR
jgi:hypothetical protein